MECKCMLKKDDEFIMGEGRAELLKLVEETGSISRAAEEMDMSYRHAWGTLRKMEKSANEELIKSQRGGDKDRGSTLTPAGKQLLKDYEALKEEHTATVYRNPSLTVDGIVTKEEKILLIERKNPPFKGCYALPGGFVEYNERVEDAVIREVEEETGLKTEIEKMVGVYSDPERDPRGHMVSVVFSLDITDGELAGGSDAVSADFFGIDDLPGLAFDHEEIIQEFLDRR
ncbi:MAG: NUDIX domain-containing protein [Candidatus Aenigmatarchaeota archaeon]